MTHSPWLVWLAVAGGSAAGGLVRHLLTEAMSRGGAAMFPWATLLINVAGSLAIGVLFGLAGSGTAAAWSPVARHGLMTGVLGGFTTFSAFSLQTVTLIEQGAVAAAVANVAASVVFGLVACWAGLALATSLR